MMITDEMLSAFIDGELEPDRAAAVSSAIETDNAVKARLQALKAPDALIAAAYKEIDDAPMPESVLALLRDRSAPAQSGGGNVIAFPGARWLRAPQQWAAPLAATLALAIGLGAGMQIASRPDNAAVTLAGLVDAGSPLHKALASTPSGETVALAGTDQRLTPVLSFKSTDGQFCREFSVSGPSSGQRALACQDNGLWRIEVAVAAAPDAGGYATASSGLSAQFDAIVDETIAGDVLGAEAEDALISSGWRGQ